MSPSNPKEVLGTETLKAMRDVASLFHDIVRPACQKRGLTAQQFYVLTELADKPRQMATELATRSGILRTNFAAVCRKMEGKGLIERERGSDDRRRVYLNITDKGRELFDEIINDVEGTLERGSVFLNEHDYLSIREGMYSLRRLLKASLE